MTRTTLAVAADYAEAMLVARRWTRTLVLLLLLLLLIQISIFLGLRFRGDSAHDYTAALRWPVNFTGFLAVVCVAVLWIALLLIVGIMLVGRLVGVSSTTSALLWCALLAVILFPWQSIWNYPVAGTAQTSPPPVENISVGPRFGLPGVLYTWPELRHEAFFPNSPWTKASLGWARFVAWPAVAIIILLGIRGRSSRGLRLALGEAELNVAGAGGAPGPRAT